MAVRSMQGRNRAAHITQGGVTLMVMDCGTCLYLSGWRFQIKYIVTKVRKTTTFCLKHLFCKKQIPLPLLHRFGTVLHSSFMWMLVFMLKKDRCKCEWKPTTNYARKYIYLVSFLHIHTKYLDLQACKKLAHGGVKAFDDYMCTSVNMKKCIRYIVNENIENTRLVLNIAQVYPARLRKSKITRLAE